MTSFSELFASVQARRESGDLAGALALFEGRERDFPLQKGLVFLVRAELLAELRQPDQAIDSLDAALASGCRYKRSWLGGNPPLVAPPRFGRCCGPPRLPALRPRGVTPAPPAGAWLGDGLKTR